MCYYLNVHFHGQRVKCAPIHAKKLNMILVFINFLISSYLTNNWLLGERVFRSWFANKIIIGIAKLGQVDEDMAKYPRQLESSAPPVRNWNFVHNYQLSVLLITYT